MQASRRLAKSITSRSAPLIECPLTPSQLRSRSRTSSTRWWFWVNDEKPTGSKDPYALRRAALGVIRITLTTNVELLPRAWFETHVELFPTNLSKDEIREAALNFDDFFHERLKVQLRDEGARDDLVDAVLDVGGREAGIVSIVRRVDALRKFLDTEDGKNLLAGYKRATNIIRIEEKKDGHKYIDRPDQARYRQEEEKVLA